VFILNALEKWRLKLICEKFSIDIQEIDNEISYDANKQHLEQFIQKSPEDLAKEYGRILSIMEKEISIGETYGVIPESEEQPLLMHKSVFLLKARSINLVKAYLKPYEKNLQFFKRSYLVVTAQITETTTIIQTLENRGVKVDLVGRSMVYQRVWQYVDGQGWRKTV
jgi:hypothetical protein